MLRHSGNLLIGIDGRSYESLERGPERLAIRGYELEPLFTSYMHTEAFSRTRAGENWFLARSEVTTESNPWDTAHQVAEKADYAFLVEPDLLYEAPSEPEAGLYSVPPSGGLNRHWPPYNPVSPGWHLGHAFTGFEDVRPSALGSGIRIAHLDTGYSSNPKHRSTPKNMKPALGWNFYENNSNAADPGTGGLLRQPGHGTATLAVVAGNELDMTFGGHRFTGYFGGAPLAEIIPVRIGASVIHFFTSAMARGIDYALAPRNNPKVKCDVVTISMGGLPSASWAAAVNHAYDAGIVVVAAAGNNIYLIVNFPMRHAVWPSRYRRVVTALGATYDKKPYRTQTIGVMQGNWGPKSIMDKAIAAFTPNIAWMLFKYEEEFVMDGGGTTMATPQIAAACALWLEKYGKAYGADWRRVEACRRALFSSAVPGDGSSKYLGRGLLNVPKMLARTYAAEQAAAKKSGAKAQPRDKVESALWWKIVDSRSPGNNKDKMLELEAAQIIYRSDTPELVLAELDSEEGVRFDKARTARIRQVIANEPDVSRALKERLAA